MYKACIFDLDGTLLDTIDSIAYTTNLSLKEFGYPPVDREKFKVMVGDGAGTLMERVMREVGADPAIFDDLLKVYLKHFEKYSTYQVAPYDGIRELLSWLKEQGIKIAVLSNKPHMRTRDNILSFFEEGYFNHIQGEMEDKGIHRKPDPSGAKLVLGILGVEKEECLYIGDTNTDMMTAKNTGLDACGAVWGFRTEEELRSFDPAYLAYHPLDIINIIKEKKM